MKAQQVSEMESKIVKFRALEKRQNEIYGALKMLTKDDPEGPCGKGPFTSNTRESRRIESLSICFTKTRGGAKATSMSIENLFIEAWEFENAIESMLRKQLKEVQGAMEDI